MSVLNKGNRLNNRRTEIVAQSFTTNPAVTTSTVTQITNRSTGVTLNTTAGQITTDATSLAAAAEATFIVTNDKCTAKCVPVIAIASGSTGGVLVAGVSAVTNGTFSITYTNTGASAETGASVINFVLLGVE